MPRARTCKPRQPTATPAPRAPASPRPPSTAPASPPPLPPPPRIEPDDDPRSDEARDIPGPGDSPDDKLAGDTDLVDAMRAAGAGEWEQALAHAQAVLQHTPRSLRALGIGVAAACHLRREGVARSLLRRMPVHRQRTMRQLCAREGVLL
jgi:hypothetical protein